MTGLDGWIWWPWGSFGLGMVAGYVIGMIRTHRHWSRELDKVIALQAELKGEIALAEMIRAARQQ